MYSKRRKGKNSSQLWLFVDFICFVLIALFQVPEIERTEKNILQSRDEILEENRKLQRQLTTLSHLPSLGFGNALAASTFLGFLQYFSDVSMQEEISQHLSPDFFNAIIKFDPFYRDYYLFLSGSTTFHAAQPEKTVDLMARGLERIDPNLVSDSFYIWRYKGSDELLFLGDATSARESFENAAWWARLSDRPDSQIVGQASEQTATFLRQDPESRYAQIAAWNSILTNAVNEDIRKRATQRIQELSENQEN